MLQYTKKPRYKGGVMRKFDPYLKAYCATLALRNGALLDFSGSVGCHQLF